MGKEFQDKCEEDDCMALLTIQLMLTLILKPIPRLLISLFLP